VQGTLYLIPTPLGDTPPAQVLPAETLAVAARLRSFVVEHAKSARAFLRQLPMGVPVQSLTLRELNEHTPPAQVPPLLAPLLAGEDVGLLSEAGCPAVADPGAELVRLAHQAGIPVRPLVGPSSILLALMGSGLVGQRFAFHGYLPVQAEARQHALRILEQRAARDDAAQVFIETPYRNAAMWQAIVTACAAETLLCVAADLTLPTQTIVMRKVADWRGHPPDLARRPAVFLLYHAPAADRPRARHRP
jgi:16S rRNA (cytidine1402-2'-O)-methyltransferase